jgi:hypothetical protein
MAVYKHLDNNSTLQRYLATDSVKLEDSKECIFFEYSNACTLKTKRILDIESVNFSEWIFTDKFVAAFGVYHAYIKGVL